jgi:hypothetical protein
VQNVQIACPALGVFSALFDVRSLDPSGLLIKLSKELGPTDIVTVYGTQDGTATGTSTNLTLIGSLPGNNGSTSNALFVAGWAFLIAVRTQGASSGGSIIASGNQNGTGGTVTPPSVALPAFGAFSTTLSLAVLAGSDFLVGLDANQTSGDTFNVYGTNDATAGGVAGAAGGQLLGSIAGGDGTAPGTVLSVSGFSYLFFQRTGPRAGGTPGTAIVWGTSVTTANLVDAVVADGPQAFGIDWLIGPGDAHSFMVQDGFSDSIGLGSGQIRLGDAAGDTFSMLSGDILLEDIAGDSIEMGTEVGRNGGISITSGTESGGLVNIDATGAVAIGISDAIVVQVGNVNTSLTVPTMTEIQRNALSGSAPPKGSIVYDTTTNQPEVNVGTTSTPIWATMASQYGGPLSLSEGQVTVTGVNLTASSFIAVSVAGPAPGAGNLTIRYDVLTASRTNGQGTGSFTISALNAAGTLQNLDVSTGVRWAITGQ